jgi:hypothetical protein
MIEAHQGKEPLPLSGTRSPWLEEAASQVPWKAPDESSKPLLRRVLGIFTGG